MPTSKRRSRISPRDILRRVAVGVAVATALGAGLVAWRSTLLGEYSVMDMGSGAMDDGRGGSVTTAHGGHGASAATSAGEAGTSVTSLTADPDRPADVKVELVAREQAIDVPGGREVQGYTLNGTSPGPAIP